MVPVTLVYLCILMKANFLVFCCFFVGETEPRLYFRRQELLLRVCPVKCLLNADVASLYWSDSISEIHGMLSVSILRLHLHYIYTHI